MKQKTYNILLIIMCTITTVIAQDIPSSISYQGVALDANGTVVDDSQISIRFTISTNNGVIENLYSERHLVQTSSLGHFSAEIGRGTIIEGLFTDITWGNGPYYLNIGLDLMGSQNYVDAGTVMIQSVPYALVAKTSGNQPEGQMGEKGPPGLEGEMGEIGPKGEKGFSGDPGIACLPIDGYPGTDGATGIDGPPGEDGAPGANGQDGPTGAKGLPGPNHGATGARGPDGVAGDQGPKGQKGVQGLPGPIALNGSPGPIGEDGPPGIGGGLVGLPGIVGLPGPKGEDGDTGLTGGTGLQGYSALVMTNQVPLNSSYRNIYLDDGSHREDGKPGFRFWNGTDWVDIKTSN